MWTKRILLGIALSLLSACDSSSNSVTLTASAQPDQASVVAATSAQPRAAIDREALNQRYTGRELTIADVSEADVIEVIEKFRVHSPRP